MKEDSLKLEGSLKGSRRVSIRISRRELRI